VTADALATTAAVVALACLAAWAVGPWYCVWFWTGVGRATRGWSIDFRTTGSAVEIVFISYTSDPGRPATGWEIMSHVRRWRRGEEHPSDWVRFGFGMARWEETVTQYGPKYTNRFSGISLPIWLIALCWGAWPVARWRRSRARRHRLMQGLCPSCGYDMRATPVRCPECGTSVTQ
jgi:hypothetical protein